MNGYERAIADGMDEAAWVARLFEGGDDSYQCEPIECESCERWESCPLAHRLCAGETCQHEAEEAGGLCEACRLTDERDAARHAWMTEAEARVESLAKAHGWSRDRWHVAQTGSQYVELTREGLDEDGDAAWQTIKVRVSDHATAHCSEDISIAMDPGYDDHTFEFLAQRLAAPFEAD